MKRGFLANAPGLALCSVVVPNTVVSLNVWLVSCICSYISSHCECLKPFFGGENNFPLQLEMRQTEARIQKNKTKSTAKEKRNQMIDSYSSRDSLVGLVIS